MIVNNEHLLGQFGLKHNQAVKPLETWLKITKQANWQHLMDVRRNFPATDGGVKGAGYTVFNIKGNSYRLVTLVNYKGQIVDIVEVLTHAKYNKWSKS